jgi:4-diphosphocytidyl-2-C-methyl-D-erythritol kinase
MKSFVIQTAAKINLCLRVLGRRSDGYHEVETVLHTVGVWDQVEIESAEEGLHVTAEPAESPQGEDNLCWRAASLLSQHAKVGGGARIHVSKRIPMRSGLGGGSSDAAATLAGLSRLWGLSLESDDLEGLGAEIGADVPALIRGGCCLARGKGERLAACPELSAWVVIVVPERRVPTSQAYAALGRGATRGRRRAPSRPVQRLLEALQRQDVIAVAQSLHNDFEGVGIPGVKDALRAKEDLLAAGCLGGLMSGSGSAVFGLVRSQDEADAVAGRVGGLWPWVQVADLVPAGKSLVINEAEKV